MSHFSNLITYAGKWNVKSVESFTEDEINSVDSAEVVDSEYGTSVKMTLKNGGYHFLPIDRRESVPCNVGQKVNLAKCFFVTLERKGDADINKIRIAGL